MHAVAAPPRLPKLRSSATLVFRNKKWKSHLILKQTRQVSRNALNIGNHISQDFIVQFHCYPNEKYAWTWHNIIHVNFSNLVSESDECHHIIIIVSWRIRYTDFFHICFLQLFIGTMVSIRVASGELSHDGWWQWLLLRPFVNLLHQKLYIIWCDMYDSLPNYATIFRWNIIYSIFFKRHLLICVSINQFITPEGKWKEELWFQINSSKRINEF